MEGSVRVVDNVWRCSAPGFACYKTQCTRYTLSERNMTTVGNLFNWSEVLKLVIKLLQDMDSHLVGLSVSS